MRAFRILLLAGALAHLFFSCKKNKPVAPETGVSRALNEHRKQTMDRIHYEIELDIPASKQQPILGKERISFHLKSTSEPVTLDFNVDSTHLKSVKMHGRDISYSFVNEHIVIDRDALEEGENEVEIVFVAGDMSLNRNEEYLYTLFVPDRASTCFPLFDQPNLKATFGLTLKTPADWEAVSNGKLLNKKTEVGKQVYQFEKSKPISSYLFAFAAGKFAKDTKTVDGLEMTMYYRETDTVKVGRNSSEIFRLHAQSLTWLEDYTEIRYPFGKFDFVLIPSFQYGGMEHPGSIFYNESALFLDENASVNQQLARASVIAHESAHMWFGDLVTMEWFNDVWLKEVFANFMAAKIVHPSFPEINHDLRFLLAHYPGAYDVDRSAGTNPILQDLGNLKNAGTLYGAIIYQKAPIVMRQLERKIGTKLMQESLREYLKKFSFANAQWDDLVNIIDEKSPLDITSWSNIWVKTSGMPAYELIAENKSIRVKQVPDSVSGRIWQQSIHSKTKTGNSVRESTLNLMNEKPLPVGEVNSLVFPNSSGVGYGYFKMDAASRNHFMVHYNSSTEPGMDDPVFKGAMLVNIWEGFLRGNGPAAVDYLTGVLDMLEKEANPLLVDYLLGNLKTLWWLFHDEEARNESQVLLETKLWELLIATPDKGMKTSYFKAYRNVALTRDGLEKLESLWNGKRTVKDLVLSEDDKIALACEMALKGAEHTKVILETQLRETKNPERKQKLQFIIPALSQLETERDAFFESLKKPENREKEAWVLEGIGYLHHPLRQQSALKYLRPSLDMLQEIQLTGDIFFPTRWLNITFGGHSGKEAQSIANNFLVTQKDYPYYLKNKVLQATDMLNRVRD